MVMCEDLTLLKTEDLATQPTKPEDQRFAFLSGKI